MSTQDWIRKGLHLPRFLRDFHDQKDLFKTIEETWGRGEEPYGINWIAAHTYVIDRFLRFMAYHGYTLQKTRRGGEYHDIGATLKDADEKRGQAFLDAVAKRREATDA